VNQNLVIWIFPSPIENDGGPFHVGRILGSGGGPKDLRVFHQLMPERFMALVYSLACPVGDYQQILFVISQVFIFYVLQLEKNNGRTDNQYDRKGELDNY
jgi:hypothetical protein